MRKWTKALIAFLLGACAVSNGAVGDPSAAYIERFQNLSPAQQEALLKSVKKQESLSSGTVEAPVEAPSLMIPVLPQSSQSVTVVDEKEMPDEPVADDQEPEATGEPLKQFGYDLFSDAPSTFAPAVDIPVDVNYVMGPGDTIQVQLFGKEHAEYSLLVSRDGTIQFPRIGPISVAGLTFAEMQQTLKAMINEQLIGEKTVITLGKLRSIRVFILGDVQHPGSYTVSALSTMTNALFVGGGVSEIGSLRQIQLKRRGKVVARMDLYDLLLHGDTSHDVRLQPGDVIFVPPVGSTLSVAGEVRRPAIYELRDEQSVAQALTLAGGLLPTAYPQASQIERINKRGERTLIDLDAGKKAGLRTRRSGRGCTTYLFCTGKDGEISCCSRGMCNVPVVTSGGRICASLILFHPSKAICFAGRILTMRWSSANSNRITALSCFPCAPGRYCKIRRQQRISSSNRATS